MVFLRSKLQAQMEHQIRAQLSAVTKTSGFHKFLSYCFGHKKPEHLGFKGYSGLYWFLLNLVLDGETRTLHLTFYFCLVSMAYFIFIFHGRITDE